MERISIHSLKNFDILNVTPQANVPETDTPGMRRTHELCRPFWLTIDNCELLMHRLNAEMIKGLNTPDDPSNDLKMINTFTTALPLGNETGKYLALDLGGTNYRLLLVTFEAPQTPPKIEEEMYVIAQELQQGESEALFGFIAGTVKKFLQNRGLLDTPIDLGFTFSFPVQQTSLNSGTLIRWTKGFDVPDAIGKDIVELLNAALKKLDLQVHCRVLVNDTVGALASCAFLDPNTAVGLIVGTGTNAAYVEKLRNAKKITGFPPEIDSVVINTEWGAFGEHGCINEFLTEFDRQVDKDSLNPGKQVFEKLISGMYLGEIARLILLKLAEEGHLFDGIVPPLLREKNGIPANILSDVERDPPHLFYSTEYVLRDAFQLSQFRSEHLKIVRYVCTSVSNRAASLVGAGLACIVNRMNRPKTTIGVDGSLFRFHPTFAHTMIEVLAKLVPSRCTFRLKLSEDGSGKGAGALVAAAKRAVATE
uniref:Phosphotransferase n=2 Tax=Schistocephalus solidus TaxID=70667 RepID=A0A0V0J1R5_SCHSO